MTNRFVSREQKDNEGLHTYTPTPQAMPRTQMTQLAVRSCSDNVQYLGDDEQDTNAA